MRKIESMGRSELIAELVDRRKPVCDCPCDCTSNDVNCQGLCLNCNDGKHAFKQRENPHDRINLLEEVLESLMDNVNWLE